MLPQLPTSDAEYYGPSREASRHLPGYRAPKTLSKAIGIMSSMCEEGHICADLFGLFLRSGVHLEYAEQYLQAQQIDEVDISAMIQTASSP
jgi:hypothetical protein